MALTIQEYWFLPVRMLPAYGARFGALPGSVAELKFHLWWIAGTLLLGVILPLLLLRVPPRELGLRAGRRRDVSTYLGLYLVMVPVLIFISREPQFHRTYPLYQPIAGPWSWQFLVFELAYCLQFLAVEFLFRGVLVLGLKPTLGRYSIAVMLAPYCMLHFHKPFPEALAAIVAGVVLGVLAYESETVLFGWGLHYGIALTMDRLALM